MNPFAPKGVLPTSQDADSKDFASPSTSRHPGVWVTGLLLLALAIACNSSLAQEDASIAGPEESPSDWQIDQWFVFTSLYTRHFNPRPEHNNDQNMLGLELWTRNHWVFGLTVFDNSYHQDSQYLYAGYRWSLLGSRQAYFKLTGGLLHGYKEPYEDKIPLNGLGVAPALTPAFGMQHQFLVAEVTLLGLSAVIVTAGFAF